MLKLNLQTFSDDEDMILPDDFEGTPTEESQDNDAFELDEPAAEDTKPADQQPAPETQEQPTEPLKIPIKYNKEERLLTVEEAAELAQKGMNYEKAVERARQEAAQQARDAYIAEQGYEWQGKKITTEAEYKQAMMERELMQKYQDQGLPEEVIKELVESRKDREERKAEKQIQEVKQQEKAMFDDFVQMYPDVKGEDIKPETWARAGFAPDGSYKPTKDSIPLKYAYMEQERAELFTKTKVLEQNQSNQQKAVVRGVSGHGTGEITSDPFLEGFDSIS